MDGALAPRQYKYEFRGNYVLERRRVKPESMKQDRSYLGQQTCNILPTEIRDSKRLREFQVRIKKGVPAGCFCQACKIYYGQLCFICNLSLANSEDCHTSQNFQNYLLQGTLWKHLEKISKIKKKEHNNISKTVISLSKFGMILHFTFIYPIYISLNRTSN